MSEEEKYNEELKELRRSLEEVDDKIVELLNKRANYAISIGNLKKNL